MRRTERSGIPYSAYTSRIQANEALGAVVAGTGSPEPLLAAGDSLKVAARTLGDSVAATRFQQFGTLIESFSRLLAWQRAIRNAEVDADRFLRSAQLMAREVSDQVSGDTLAPELSASAAKLSGITNVCEVSQIARMLLCIPLPLPVFTCAPARSDANSIKQEPRKRPPAVAVAFASFTIDGVQFSATHTIQPQVVHDLAVEVAISRWPDGANELVLEPVSVEPRGSYDLPVFSFDKPSGEPPYTLSKTGRMVLPLPQMFFARPLEFTYRARFKPHVEGVELVVQGQRHLYVQCYDPNLDPQSGYVQVDRRILELRAEARALPGIPDKELSDFLMFLAAVGNIAGQSLQDNIFPRVYSEAEFQDEMKSSLRQIPRIGSELEEHPTAGGGITDLSFRRIRLEIKVRSDRSLVREDADQYVPQTAQYAVGSDKRFALLTILDSSPKTLAPGSMANDIFLRVVPAPAGGTLPICVGIVIIRGNIARPSDLSRKSKRT